MCCTAAPAEPAKPEPAKASATPTQPKPEGSATRLHVETIITFLLLRSCFGGQRHSAGRLVVFLRIVRA